MYYCLSHTSNKIYIVNIIIKVKVKLLSIYGIQGVSVPPLQPEKSVILELFPAKKCSCRNISRKARILEKKIKIKFF